MIRLINLTLKFISCVPSSIFVFCCFLNAGLAAEQTFTVDAVGNGLSNSKKALTDIRIEYVSQVRVYMDDNSNIVHRVEATYAQKLPGTFRFLDRKVSRINIDSGEIVILTDGWASYDGNATYTLDRNVRSGKPKHGYIRAGYNSAYFPQIDIDPYTNMWNHGKRSLDSIIQQNKINFQVVKDAEAMEGISTILISGNLSDDKLAMKLWVSPEHSFLPMKRQIFNIKDGKLMSEMVLSNLIRLPNGLWFPKSVRFGSPDPNWAFYQEISNISIDPISEKLFTPEFPPDTEVVDEVLGLRYEK